MSTDRLIPGTPEHRIAFDPRPGDVLVRRDVHGREITVTVDALFTLKSYRRGLEPGQYVRIKRACPNMLKRDLKPQPIPLPFWPPYVRRAVSVTSVEPQQELELS